MPSAYTQSLRLTQQATGENDDTWGIIENEEVIQRLEDAIAGSAVITAAGAVLLTSVNGGPDQARMHCLVCTGVAKVITAPNVPKTYLVDATANAGSVTITTGQGGATAVVEAGNRMWVNSPDGINCNLVRDVAMQAALNAAIAAGDAASLLAAKAYADQKMVSGTVLPSPVLPGAVVYGDPASATAGWHVLTSADISDFASAVNVPLAAVQALVDADTIQLAALALTTAVSTMTPNGRGFQDDYADATGVDQANSSGINISVGDVNNMTAIQNGGAPDTSASIVPVVGSTGATLSGQSTTTRSSDGFSNQTVYVETLGYQGKNYALSVFQTSGGGNALASVFFDNNLNTTTGPGRGSASTSATINASTPWIEVQLPAPVSCTGFAVRLNGDVNSPTGFTLKGSNDGVNYTTLGTLSGFSTASGTVASTSFASNTTAYSYFRVYPTGNAYDIFADIYLYAPIKAPAAATLRAQPANLSFTPRRAYQFHLAKLGAGATLNTDLVGSVGRTAAAFTSGTYKALATYSSGYSLIGLYGSDGKLGVDISAQASAQSVFGKDVMTAAARIDIAASFYGGA